VGGLNLTEVPAISGEAQDVDTWEDLLALRERLQG
jgi:CTP:molybdopterin cytidylyltransferase MocA